MINYSEQDLENFDYASAEFSSESTISQAPEKQFRQQLHDSNKTCRFNSSAIKKPLKVFNPCNSRSCGHINLYGRVCNENAKDNDEICTTKKRLIERPNKKESVIVICSLCQKELKSSCALGGHMSRKHQNQSEKYSRKKEKERMREHEREKNYLIKQIINQDLQEIFQ